MSRGFEAAYYGRCTMCGDRVEPGDMIASDGDGGFAHDYCVDDEPLHAPAGAARRGQPVLAVRRETLRRVCTRCNQEIPAALMQCENCS